MICVDSINEPEKNKQSVLCAGIHAHNIDVPVIYEWPRSSQSATSQNKAVCVLAIHAHNLDVSVLYEQPPRSSQSAMFPTIRSRRRPSLLMKYV